MAKTRLRLALRDWDHVMPLVTGAVRAKGIELDLDLRAVTPNVLDEPDIDGGETSFSRYALAHAGGDDRLIGLPVFVMRGFRQRCVLVRADSGLTSAAQLAGTRIGLTGWVDSGNTWTRALLREAGVPLDSIRWTIGPLSAGETGKDRVGPFSLPHNVDVLGEGDSLTAGLADGRFDAIFTPFMPEEMFGPDSRFRHLYRGYPGAEEEYFLRNGFVPGIHLLTVKRAAVQGFPDVLDAVAAAFDAAKHHWWSRRRLLADTTPWLLDQLRHDALLFGEDWMPYGLTENKAMIEAFCAELNGQGIAPDPVDAEALFTDFVQLTNGAS
ncbi:hypothetical protein [Sciscionella sediminilitoris]|uniref:hypothetical protein n=1 Tax=Sciscionella sediminilitoris TaxID=1445613 RepID=UPI00055BBF2B|nr:hypothetical protein [Sciscionella sp. SE31]